MPSKEFAIRNINCGKYVHRFDGVKKGRLRREDLILHHGQNHSNARFVFEHIENGWGYIKLKKANSVIHPLGGYSSLSRGNGNPNVTLHKDRKRWALFAFDLNRNYIVHRDGKFVHYNKGRSPYPPDYDPINLHPSKHKGMQWELVNPRNRNEKINPYGSAKISGDWELVYRIDNPKAEQKVTYRSKIGKSQTKSTSHSFEFKWENTIAAGVAFAEMSAGFSSTTTLSTQIKSASSETWYSEFEKEHTIIVNPGRTVFVWQKHFIGEQHGHKAVFQTPHFSHTHRNVKPRN